jgi:cardiolipin synthase
VSRDHRKTIAVDSEVAFVSGLCVGEPWKGNPAKGREPWRDTGIELRGPAVADVERAFAKVWSELGSPLPKGERVNRTNLPRPGSMRVRIVASHPGSAGLFRLDHIVAAAARKTLWLTDAYFAGVPPYVAALQAASRDGVDVRLLVPGASDIPLLRPVTQSGYRPLLTAGVRVFEWNGAMLHAKTAVADSRWSRVGSSNLNVASWLGNYELDAVVENEDFAREMERMYLDDLRNATEIVLERRRRGRAGHKTARSGGSVSRVAAGAIRLGNVVNAAMTARRVLPAPDRRIFGVSGLLLLVSAVVFIWRPRLVAVPIGVVAAVTGLALIVTALGRNKKTAPAAMPNRGPGNPR